MNDRSRNRRLARRRFLKNVSMTAGGIALAGPFGMLAARHRTDDRRVGPGPYGPVLPAADLETGLELLRLPEGFVYRSMSWSGDPMDDGAVTPERHDGMAVVQVTAGRHQDIVLIRNHENGPAPLLGGPGTPVYDDFSLPGLGIEALGGGTTALTVRRGRLVDARGTLAGTLSNCAGGPTPWGSWLSCEEIVTAGSLVGGRDHGWCFEVPSPLIGTASAEPIVDMGLLVHEAVAVDPRTGMVYETEDNSDFSGFYRYTPKVPGQLAQGGALEMLRVLDKDNVDLRSVAQGQAFETGWVPVDDPAQLPEDLISLGGELPPILLGGPSGPYAQGFGGGGAQFKRLEGAWYHEGVIYFADTRGGPTGNGVIWAFEPEATTGLGHGRLTAIFVSTDASRADNPDNVTVSKHGGVLFCEDNARTDGTRLIGLDTNGSCYEFCRNNMNLPDGVAGRPAIAATDYRDAEFAGATFDPTGRYLFVNIQTPGVTFVISGPWKQGNLY